MFLMSAWLFGDPHIITMDEREYTFNGWGEYTLIDVTSGNLTFVLQGRTSLMVTDRGSVVNATVFTAFGAQENGTRVFVELDPNTNNCECQRNDEDVSLVKFNLPRDVFTRMPGDS